MTFEETMAMLQEADLPLAYDHFAEGESPDPPFLVFLFPESENVFADDRNRKTSLLTIRSTRRSRT